MVKFVQQALENMALHQALTETADRGGVRHFVVIQGKTRESNKGEAVAQGLLRRRIA